MMDYDDMRMKIRHLRLERRMTQKQLADAMHVSCSLIGHIERGYENIVEKLRGLGADISKVERMPAALDQAL